MDTGEPQAGALYHRAVQLAQAGRHAEAEASIKELVQRWAIYAPGWRLASELALRAGQPELALGRVEQGLTQVPGDSALQLQRVRCLVQLRRRVQALTAAREMLRASCGDPNVLDALGGLCSAAGDHPLALAAYERALTIDPSRTLTRFNRAAVRRFLGDLAGAESDYDAVIAATPEDCEAWLNRSELRRQTNENNHLEGLEALLARGTPGWPGEVQIRYALAKEYEDLQLYARSWSHLEAGARLRRAHLEYDITRDVRTAEQICRAFPAAVEDDPAVRPAEPIFIVGLPRSGTTLVERILSGHNEVTAAGELDDFALALTDAVRAGSPKWPLSREELIAASSRLDLRALGAAYLTRARPADLRTAHFTDKMPLNYLYCGLIARALPGARIVHVTREPMAVGYAMYKTLFRQGYPFSYDLVEIGLYIRSYQHLMQHWEATLPGVIHRLSYERLVGDIESETRRLLEFCALPWQQQCLAFESNPAPTTSASAAQVRQGLYRTSLEQWRHYARQLRPLASVFTSEE